MVNHPNILWQIIQNLAIDKLNTLGLTKNEKLTCFNCYNVSESIFRHPRYYIGFSSMFVKGYNENIEKQLLELSVIEKTGDCYWIDPEDDDEDVKKLDIDIIDGKKEYGYNGYEIFLEESDIIYEYKLTDAIINEAIEIYKSRERDIEDENKVLTFDYENVNYTVPLYALLLINVFNDGVDMKDKMMRMTIDKKGYNKIAQSIDDVNVLINAATETTAMNTVHWKRTIYIVMV